jgi:hypothetical protein
VHKFQGTPPGAIAAVFSVVFAVCKSITAPVANASGAKKQEQQNVWLGTPIALLNAALSLS